MSRLCNIGALCQYTFVGMDVQISIGKSVVLTEVYKITGKTGIKGGDVEQIASTGDDAQVLNSLFLEAANSLSDVLTLYGSLSSVDDEAIFDITLPANWKTSVQSAMELAMMQYMANSICMRWFNFAKKDETAHYAAVCSSQAAFIRKCILERERPSRS